MADNPPEPPASGLSFEEAVLKFRPEKPAGYYDACSEERCQRVQGEVAESVLARVATGDGVAGIGHPGSLTAPPEAFPAHERQSFRLADPKGEIFEGDGRRWYGMQFYAAEVVESWRRRVSFHERRFEGLTILEALEYYSDPKDWAKREVLQKYRCATIFGSSPPLSPDELKAREFWRLNGKLTAELLARLEDGKSKLRYRENSLADLADMAADVVHLWEFEWSLGGDECVVREKAGAGADRKTLIGPRIAEPEPVPWSSNKAEAAYCKRLVREAQRGAPGGAKDWYYKERSEEFEKLSRRGFDRCWAAAVVVNERWGRAGPRKRPPPTEKPI
jgi:hypothetical protein